MCSFDGILVVTCEMINLYVSPSTRERIRIYLLCNWKSNRVGIEKPKQAGIRSLCALIQISENGKTDIDHLAR